MVLQGYHSHHGDYHLREIGTVHYFWKVGADPGSRVGFKVMILLEFLKKKNPNEIEMEISLHGGAHFGCEYMTLVKG